MEIISERHTETRVWYERYFKDNDCPGAGYSFECDESGNPLPLKWPEAERNWQGCITGEFNVTDKGIERKETSYNVPAVGRCECGREVSLDGFTNTCECDRDYNSAGQLLAPRSQWGEETGEYLSDILRIP